MLCEQLNEMAPKLDEATEKKDYATCAEMAAKMQSIVKELEARLAAVQHEAVEALSRDTDTEPEP